MSHRCSTRPLDASPRPDQHAAKADTASCPATSLPPSSSSTTATSPNCSSCSARTWPPPRPATSRQRPHHRSWTGYSSELAITNASNHVTACTHPCPTSSTRSPAPASCPPTDAWPSRSEARQSVLTHALWRGASLADIRRLIAPGQPWAGLSAAYTRYGAHHDKALLRDWTAAQRWLAVTIPRFQTATHKKQHTGGSTGPRPHRLWLAHALWWCDITLRSHPQRWAAAAVLQALAVSAVRAGELVNGVPVVAVGGRSLSIAAGLLNESTVWAVLRTLRDMPGAPILLVAKGTGLNADRYALTTPDVCDPHPYAPARPAVTDVHDAWSVIGLQHRRIYETIAATGFDNARVIASAARTSQSSTYASLAELTRIGLLRRRHGTITLGDTSLDDIATQHRLPEARSTRITAHRAARLHWQAWLATRRIPPAEPPTNLAAGAPAPLLLPFDVISEADYLSTVMATGPPHAWLQPMHLP